MRRHRLYYSNKLVKIFHNYFLLLKAPEATLLVSEEFSGTLCSQLIQFVICTVVSVRSLLVPPSCHVLVISFPQIFRLKFGLPKYPPLFAENKFSKSTGYRGELYAREKF